MRRRTRGRRPPESPDPDVTMGGISIPKVSTIRILGLLIQKDGIGGAELEKVQRTVQQGTHRIKRVSSKPHGLKEKDCIIMIQALLTSTITYGASYVEMKTGSYYQDSAIACTVHETPRSSGVEALPSAVSATEGFGYGRRPFIPAAT
ncbi:hypothetical protein HPB50_022448 [Hyalomma asiaticum]|uniref:Uncharacterized protein n=1 Tax=Hyalomma asiaticum TaxID=266040 RepID=A0ACB7TLS2_HYAAI|nr:hypothetical protein HPB50_022448 [Hyalomma asiaticum]